MYIEHLQLEWCLGAQMRLNDPLVSYLSLEQGVFAVLHEQMRVVHLLRLNIKLLTSNRKRLAAITPLNQSAVGFNLNKNQKWLCELFVHRAPITYLFTLINPDSDILKGPLLNATVFWISPSHEIDHRALFSLLDSLLVSILYIIFDLVGSLIVHYRLKSYAADSVSG